MKRSDFIFILFALLCFAASAARADCDQQQVPLTAKEKAYYSSKFPVLHAAIPKPPAGWQYDDDSTQKLAPDYQDYMPKYNCGPSNYYIGLDIGYERPMTQADSDKEMAAMQAPPDPAKQKKVDALIAQEQALMQKIADAAQKQDTKGMDALGKQNDALTRQLQAAQQDLNAGSRATMDAVQRDRKATVRIAINDGAGDVSCYGNPKPIQVPGATAYSCENPATYSSPGEQLDAPAAHIVVVFGKATVDPEDWDRQDATGKIVKDHSVDIKTPLVRPVVIGVQFVIVDVKGDDLARAQSLYKQMNLGPLSALVKH